MVTVEDFSRLVSGVHAAALTPQRWEPALDEIRRALGGTAGALCEAAGGVWSIRATTAPADVGKTYAERYQRLDYVLAGVENGPLGAVRTGTELIAPRTHTEFYNDWMRPNDMDDGLFVRLTGGSRAMCFIVAAPRRTESFDTLERVKLVSGLVPHLQQALRTQNELTALARSDADLVAALDVVRHGIIIVGSDWWVINLNTAAERILRAEDGMQMQSARIAATSMPADRQLCRALRGALTDDGAKIRSGRSFLCERPSGKRPYVVHVLPLHRATTDEMSSEARALVLIIDPDQEPDPAAVLLRRLYGLTKAEADVALRMMHGADPKQISDELSVSLTTVRTHLQHVFDKTETHRQAELVRLLLVLSP
jgi:DNA-binding CsgD family transcriptional regulator/PAS domain-containing protein